jgi:TPP-dependent 2-oxoacid decarboxylase
MLRRGVQPYLFVLNNDGYEIERQIHGEKAEYNNIQMYDHQALLPFLAGKKSKVSLSFPSDQLNMLTKDPIRVNRGPHPARAFRPVSE